VAVMVSAVLLHPKQQSQHAHHWRYVLPGCTCCACIQKHCSTTGISQVPLHPLQSLRLRPPATSTSCTAGSTHVGTWLHPADVRAALTLVLCCTKTRCPRVHVLHGWSTPVPQSGSNVTHDFRHSRYQLSARLLLSDMLLATSVVSHLQQCHLDVTC
jgi:hypothetical protein